jgi:hypothetical protein
LDPAQKLTQKRDFAGFAKEKSHSEMAILAGK